MRGQSATEYIVTYGWAILALVIVIGVLISSGILSPTYLISDECNAGTNLPCKFALVDNAGSTDIILEIHNGFAYGIDIEDMNVTNPATGEQFIISSPSFSGVDVIDSGNSITISGTYEGEGFPVDSYERFHISLLYASCAAELLAPGEDCSDSYHVISGRVSGRVIADES